MFKFLALALLVSGFGVASFATATESVQVTVRGVLHEDKNGFFCQVNGIVYDIAVNDESRAEMHKFYSDLKGDLVTITGSLHVQVVKEGKPYMIVSTNEIVRLKGERVEVVRVEEQRPVVREYYVERQGGIDLPLVRIRW